MTSGPCADDDLLCQQVVELVTDYLEGVLSATTRGMLEHHLSICEECRVYFEQIQQVILGLSSIQPVTLTPTTRLAILEIFREVRPPAPLQGQSPE